MNMFRKNRERWHRLRQALRGASPLPTLLPKQGYDRWAPTYAEGMNPVQQQEAPALARLLPSVRGRAVLDLGCGKGRVCRLALERGAARVVGLDFSEPMLEAADAALQSPRVDWVRGDLRALPFEAASFDVVTCALVMGHVEGLEAVLAEAARVLQPGGWLVVSDFHPYATLRGWQRSFVEVQSGQAYAIRQHLHLFEDYLRGFAALGLTLDALEEPRHEGFPVVFVLRARKQALEGSAAPGPDLV
jgi:malonyl-CoA O-methyltransferase